MEWWHSAIIGGIGGAVGGLLVLQAQRARVRSFVAALQRGDAGAARAFIEKHWPNRGRLGVYQVIPLLSRFTALGAIGELDRIRDEAARLPAGNLTSRTQVLGHALLVRRLLGDPSPELVASL